MKRSLFLFALFTIFGCGGAGMRRLTDVELSRSDLSVANSAQTTFQRTSGLSVAPLGSYAGLTAEGGGLSVVTSLSDGCYMLVGTTQVPMAEIDVGATNLSGELVNHGIERNDWYQTGGMAARGFCLAQSGMVTLGAVARVSRMAVLLALYPARDSNALVRAVSTLQNSERNGMRQVLSGIASGMDASAAALPWAGSLPVVMRERTSAISGLPAGATAGMCVLVAATGAGGPTRDVDLYVFTGEPPPTPDRMLASDDRINPNAAVVFTVPADPSSVRVAVQSYTGSGPIEYSAYRVRSEACTGNMTVPIPGATASGGN